MKKIRVIILVVLLLISIKPSLYPRFGFSLMYSPLTFIKYADMGMSVGGNIFFDNTLLNKTSVRLCISGEYIFYKYEEYIETGGVIDIPGMPEGLPGTVKKKVLISEFLDGYSFGIGGEYIKEYGGYYYSFGAGFGIGLNFAFIGSDFTGSASIKFPFRMSYPITRSGIKMYIEFTPVINIPLLYTSATNFFDASGYIAFPISIGFRF